MNLTIALPDRITLATRERDENAPTAVIIPAQLDPAIAAEIFTYGLQVIINRAANTEANVPKALEAAARLNAGSHWRTRAAGESVDSLTAECRKIAEAAVKAAKPAGTKTADWLTNPKVKAKIAEIMARPKTIEDAKAIIAARAAAKPESIDLDNL